MRVLVTGADGFVGRYLVKALASAGDEPLLLDISFSSPVNHPSWCFDLRDSDAVHKLLSDTKPDASIHLAALSFVPDGIKDPAKMLSVNVAGTVNLLDALCKNIPDSPFLCISTSQVYGTHPGKSALHESDPLRPTSLYAISKAAADMAALGYSDAYGLNIITARPGNHTGPGQSPRFAIPAFAEKIFDAAQNNTKFISVGNLESVRDITDVRDVVKAYISLIKSGKSGNAYNISSGNHLKMSDVIDILCEIAGVFPERVIDADLFRPTDHSPHLDTSLIKAHTEWNPDIPVRKTVEDIYSFISESL